MTQSFIDQLAEVSLDDEFYYYCDDDDKESWFTYPQCPQCVANGFPDERFSHVSALLQHLENTNCKAMLKKPGMRKFLDVVVDDDNKED
jgi:hypothetical protein